MTAISSRTGSSILLLKTVLIFFSLINTSLKFAYAQKWALCSSCNDQILSEIYTFISPNQPQITHDRFPWLCSEGLVLVHAWYRNDEASHLHLGTQLQSKSQRNVQCAGKESCDPERDWTLRYVQFPLLDLLPSVFHPLVILQNYQIIRWLAMLSAKREINFILAHKEGKPSNSSSS